MAGGSSAAFWGETFTHSAICTRFHENAYTSPDVETFWLSGLPISAPLEGASKPLNSLGRTEVPVNDDSPAERNLWLLRGILGVLHMEHEP